MLTALQGYPDLAEIMPINIPALDNLNHDSHSPSFKMRQRITFLQHPQDSLDPDLLLIEGVSITSKDFNAAREDRIALSFDELPQELYRLLKGSHELHIRWSTSKNFESIAPLVSRLSPGLHIFWNPQRSGNSSYAFPMANSYLR